MGRSKQLSGLGPAADRLCSRPIQRRCAPSGVRALDDATIRHGTPACDANESWADRVVCRRASTVDVDLQHVRKRDKRGRCTYAKQPTTDTRAIRHSARALEERALGTRLGPQPAHEAGGGSRPCRLEWTPHDAREERRPVRRLEPLALQTFTPRLRDTLAVRSDAHAPSAMRMSCARFASLRSAPACNVATQVPLRS